MQINTHMLLYKGFLMWNYINCETTTWIVGQSKFSGTILEGMLTRVAPRITNICAFVLLLITFVLHVACLTAHDQVHPIPATADHKN